jgi:NAD(P)H-hydrate epimerase
VVVLKGGPTVVVSSRTRWTNTTGNPGIATAGSGDVLTGMITSLLGQGLSTWDAAVLGVWIHGRAGDLAAERLGQSAMVAVDLLGALPEATRELVPQS